MYEYGPPKRWSIGMTCRYVSENLPKCCWHQLVSALVDDAGVRLSFFSPHFHKVVGNARRPDDAQVVASTALQMVAFTLTYPHEVILRD